MNISRACLVPGLLFLLGAVPMAQGYDRYSGGQYQSRSEVIAKNGMAATSQPLATGIAVGILKNGGNAVDAAIAANAALGLMEPTGSGIGGDLFAIVWDAKKKKLFGLNSSGRSPMSLSLDEFRRLGYEYIPERGPLSVSVPGAVAGWFALHERFGRLPMSDLLQPAIEYANNGFPVSEVIAYSWARNAEILGKYDGFSDTFMPGGKTPAKGQVFKNPSLAKTYSIIAEKGRDGFYKGDVAKTIAAYMKEQGGYLSAGDLAVHKAEWVDPVSTDYRGYTVWELPPNVQGIAALQILNLLEPYDLSAMRYGSADYLHVFTEAKKIVYEDRAKYYADMQFVDVPVAQLVSKSYARERGKLIDMARAAKSYPSGNPMGAAAIEHGDTIYLTTADADGNMVSLIQSNYSGMGSGMTPDDLGFVLQNRGTLFALDKDHANVFEPGKRPFHTIIPAFVTKDGKPYMSFGVMGGAYQPQGHAQILINVIDFGMNLQEAGDAPRMRHYESSQPTGQVMSNGGTLNLETGFADSVVEELENRGHTVIVGEGFFGGYQAIKKDTESGMYTGASESRKDGHAAGY